MSVDLSAAHLRRLELQWLLVDADSEALRTSLSIVSRCSTLEDLKVCCDTPGEHSLVAKSPCSAYCSFAPVGIMHEWLEWQFCFVGSTDRRECEIFIFVLA